MARPLRSNQQNLHYLSYWIGQGIYSALTNNKYIGVEFFPVASPGNTVTLVLPSSDIQDQTVNTKYTLAITINTNVVDAY
jgi:hypothetical protein